MAVTQYIGAAYVAHGWTTWDAQTSYDNMYVVEYQNGNYISKKNVPPGVSPAGNQGDNEYWAWFGVKSAQMEEYRQEVEEVKNNIETVNTEITQINQEINDINKELVNISNVKNRNVILLGDSWGAGFGAGVYTTGWCEYFKNMSMAKTTQYFAVNSYGFIGNNLKFIDLLKNNISKITTPLEQITDVIVCGGLNDKSNTIENIIAAITEFTTYTKLIMPNANIYIGVVGNTQRADFSIANTIIPAYTNGALYNGCIPLQDTEYACTRYKWYADEIHYTAQGYKKVAEAIYTAWITGSANVNFPYTSTELEKSENVTTISGTIAEVLFGKTLTINLTSLDLTFTPFNWVPNTQTLNIAVNNTNFIRKSSITHVPCSVWAHAGNNWVLVPCQLYFGENSIMLKGTLNSTDTSTPLENVTRLYFAETSFNAMFNPLFC